MPGTRPTPVPRPAPTPRRCLPAESWTLHGVDTSHYQSGRIDLKAHAAAGCPLVIVKATEGDPSRDPTYRKRVRQARAQASRRGLPLRAS